MQCRTADEKESISAYELINRQISHCWLRNTLIGLLFDLKNPGIFRSLGNLYISRLCYTSRFSGTALNGLRTSSLEPAFGKWGHGPGTLGVTQFHPYLSFSLFFFIFDFSD